MRRSLFFIALLVIFLFGSYASFKTGVTWDTEQEQRILVTNIKAARGLIKGDYSPYQTLIDYSDKYYGIGFHAPASVIQSLAYKSVARHFGLDNATAYLATKQWLAFDLFFVSALLFFLLSRRVTEDESFSMLAALGYLLWPYLLGQSFIDIKDPPFLFAWFLCFYLSATMAEGYCRTRQFDRVSVCLLAILTGWATSIRLPGVLLLLQYGIVFLVAWRRVPVHSSGEIRTLAKHLLLFSVVVTAFVYLAYPIFWLGPERIFSAFDYMRHHPLALLGHCTLTLGECMPAADLPATYLPAWLSVKLPLIVIAGFLALPFAFRKFPDRASIACVLEPAIYASTTILALLWLTGAMLYNEIRHILFLMPLFFFSGIHSLYFFSRKLTFALLAISVFIFSMDNFLSFPYQYIWFNEVARRFQLENYFETDYWGSSGPALARNFLNVHATGKPFDCAYIDGDLTVRQFIIWQTIGCVRDELPGPEAKKPLYIVGYTRTIEHGLHVLPSNCDELWRERLRLLSGKEIVLGRVVYCH